jgi:hypothetical protein
MFLTKTYNSATGIIAANVYVKGIEVLVYIDDYFPTQSGDGAYGLAFAEQANEDGTIWVPSIEKIWAKVNGNYDFIQAGNPVEVYDFLLGTPTK